MKSFKNKTTGLIEIPNNPQVIEQYEKNKMFELITEKPENKVTKKVNSNKRK